MGVWVCGSVGVWVCGRKGESAAAETPNFQPLTSSIEYPVSSTTSPSAGTSGVYAAYL